MLTRIYLDNYKCFSNFELTLGPLQLLLGGNGTGKSSILDAIANLQSLLVGRGGLATPTYQADLTRWDNRNRQVLEVDVQRPLDQATFRYHVEFELDYNKLSRKVIGETLTCNGKFLYRTEDEKTEALINGTWNRVLVSPTGSGVPFVPLGTSDLDWFRDFIHRIIVLRPSPVAMAASGKEEDYLHRDGSNFVAWYRGLEPHQLFEDKQRLHEKLRGALAGFDSLRLLKGHQERILSTTWKVDSGSQSPPYDLIFSEISDGQRMLVLLYTLVTLPTGSDLVTLLLDEPTNFVSLTEIEPWLRELEERTEEGKLQAIVVSHNSEVLDSWAGAYGIRFARDAAGPVRVSRFAVEANDPLTPSERIARGWDNENDENA